MSFSQSQSTRERRTARPIGAQQEESQQREASWRNSMGLVEGENRITGNAAVTQMNSEAVHWWTFNRSIEERYPPVQATGTADGAPIQDEKPAAMTFKQRQQENRKAKEAGRLGPKATAFSYDMATALQTSNKEKRNSLAAHRDLVSKSGVDERVLLAFSRGYREKGILNKRPATEQEAANKAQDDKFYEDYCSNNLQRRQPHLEKMVDELINVHYSTEMFTERYLRQNARQMGELENKMLCLDNVMKDPINAPFFERLDPYRKAALEEGFSMFVRFRAALDSAMKEQGVDLDNAGYLDKDVYSGSAFIESDMAKVRKGVFDNSVAMHEQRMMELRAEQAERVRKSATSYAERMRAGEETLNNMKSVLEEDPDVRLTEEEAKSQFFNRAHVLLQSEEGADEQNLSTMKTLTEVSRLKNERPSDNLYGRVHDLVAPRVERIMACDVDELAALNDDALMLRNEEIDSLFLDNMVISDLMKIKHPTMTEGGENGAVPTLRDELVGYRNEQYIYKQMMLRGLHERARALAIRRSMENGYPTEEMFVKEDRTLEKGKEKEWLQSRMEVGDRTIAQAREHRAGFMTLSTSGIKDAYIRNRERINDSDKLSGERDPMVGGLEKLLHGDTVDAAKIMFRLRNDNYYSLEYSEEELANMKSQEDSEAQENGETQENSESKKKKKVHTNIGEGLFRSFDAFMGQEAAQKLLTPEKAREMVLNLAAGAGMHKNGVWKEPALNKEGKLERDENGAVIWVNMDKKDINDEKRKEALEKNKQGLAVHKEVYRAQFDMLTRKYGNKVEELSVEDCVTHQAEMVRDFKEMQVAIDMADRYPGYFEEGNPEDELLRNRIDYYAFVGCAILGTIYNVFAQADTFAGEQEMRDELKNSLQSQITIDAMANAAYEWLSANDPAFSHGIDWSQRVRVPGEDAE